MPALGQSWSLPFIGTLGRHGTYTPPLIPNGQLDLSKATLTGFNLSFWMV